MNAEEIGVASKTQEFDDSLMIDSQWIQFLKPVLALLKEGKPEAMIFQFRYERFVEELDRACNALRIPRMVPYEMRHSGPSHDRLTKARTLLEVQKRGRWRIVRSLVRYEKHTRMLQAWNKLPAEVRAHAERCQREVGEFMLGIREAPPPLPRPGTGAASTGTSRS